tara:strand:- start:1270 stop:2034 length:765 start_codon:yes stop_codon:yes gene_type:complete
MALNFPDNPSVNQIYHDSTSGFSYVWNGTVWISFESSDLSTVVELDDISGSFNSSLTTFTLSVNGTPMGPRNATQLQIYLGGVAQNPNSDFVISGSNVIFTTPPAAGLNFVGILLGVSFPVSSVSDNSISLSKLTADAKGVGIRSDGVLIGTAATTFNFLGIGHTFAVSSGTVDIDLKTGVGTAINYDAGNKSPFSYVDTYDTVNENIVLDTVNSGLSTSVAFTIVPRLEVATGVAITVGLGKSLVIDALQLGV